MASQNSYLIRNRYSFCFRLKVPVDLQKFVRRKELRYTLNTNSQTEAEEKARLIAGQIQKLFRHLKHCGDVVSMDGVWCLDINDDGKKRLKNAPSKRIVPLHPVLTETLSFPGFVKKLKKMGETGVFPELKKVSHAWSHSASKWFNGR